MTAQFNDIFQYKNKDYQIAAIEYPGAFFDVRALGLNPEADCTACWRGYIAIFGIDSENRLVLVELYTNNGEKPAPVINGVRADVHKVDPADPELFKKNNQYTFFAGKLQYFNVNLPIRYSGKLTAADGFIKERYVHMGYHAPSSYEKVIEFTFEDGILVDANDISECAAKKRTDECAMDPFENYGDEWIERTFDLSYKSKWA